MPSAKTARPLSPAYLKSRGAIPRHVAIIMDGNGRWAARRGVPRLWGHRAGRKSVREAIGAALDLGVEILTLYTFSTENWERPRREVEGLMRFLMRTLDEEIDELEENGVRLRVIGRLADLSPSVRQVVRGAMERLEGNRRLELVLALSYSGRAELVDAVRGILAEARRRAGGALHVDEHLIARHLYTAGLPDPDLLIRTSGEMRLSNFLLWQVAYTELWVTETLWPDFRRRHFLQAVADFQGRERRFGRID
jgi:undecaprenyl diphosphate synthase